MCVCVYVSVHIYHIYVWIYIGTNDCVSTWVFATRSLTPPEHRT